MIACTTLALGLTLGSYHFDRQTPLESFNPGAYAICDNWTAGIYRNSFRRTSVFAGRVFSLGPIDLTVGLVTGYEKRRIYDGPARPGDYERGCTGYHCIEDQGHGGKISPIILPSVKMGNFRVGVIPPLLPKQKGALTLAVEW
jgi:hypothetical protein